MTLKTDHDVPPLAHSIFIGFLKRGIYRFTDSFFPEAGVNIRQRRSNVLDGSRDSTLVSCVGKNVHL